MPEGGKIKITCTNNTDIIPETQGNLVDNKVYVKISVEDTGYGIPDEHLEKIFGPYFTTKPPMTFLSTGESVVMVWGYATCQKNRFPV